MKTISLKLVGTKPLMVHNPRVVDPFDDSIGESVPL